MMHRSTQGQPTTGCTDAGQKHLIEVQLQAHLALLVSRQHQVVTRGVELHAGAAPGVQLEHGRIDVPPQLVVRVLLWPACGTSLVVQNRAILIVKCDASCGATPEARHDFMLSHQAAGA